MASGITASKYKEFVLNIVEIVCKLSSILTCCIVGSFLLLMGPSIPLHSSLHLIVSNSFHRQTLEDFRDVVVVVPTQTADVVLMSLWPALAILGLMFQYYRQSGRPDFEMPRRNNQQGYQVGRHLFVDTSEDEILNEANSSNERNRLIPSSSDSNRTNYHSVHDSSPDRMQKKGKNHLR